MVARERSAKMVLKWNWLDKVGILRIYMSTKERLGSKVDLLSPKDFEVPKIS